MAYFMEWSTASQVFLLAFNVCGLSLLLLSWQLKLRLQVGLGIGLFWIAVNATLLYGLLGLLATLVAPIVLSVAALVVMNGVIWVIWRCPMSEKADEAPPYIPVQYFFAAVFLGR